MDVELKELLITELAEIKARQQAINEVTLLAISTMVRMTAALTDNSFDENMFSAKYEESYQHYRRQYQQESRELLRFTDEDSLPH